MKCAIEGCVRERGAGLMPLCDEHATDWLGSGEHARGSEIPFDLTTGETGDDRRELALGDFIRRISSEERNTR